MKIENVGRRAAQIIHKGQFLKDPTFVTENNPGQRKFGMLYALDMTILKTCCWLVKELIRLYVYLLVIFTPYCDPSTPPWKVVDNSMPHCC